MGFAHEQQQWLLLDIRLYMRCSRIAVRGISSLVRVQAPLITTWQRSTRACTTVCANMQKKKVLVVGAGFAGITAARTLLAEATAPLEVVVLEASSRVGGRAHTMEVNLGQGMWSASLAALSSSFKVMQRAA